MLVRKAKTVLPSDNRQSVIDFIGVVSRGLKLFGQKFSSMCILKIFMISKKKNEKARNENERVEKIKKGKNRKTRVEKEKVNSDWLVISKRENLNRETSFE